MIQYENVGFAEAVLYFIVKSYRRPAINGLFTRFRFIARSRRRVSDQQTVVRVNVSFDTGEPVFARKFDFFDIAAQRIVKIRLEISLQTNARLLRAVFASDKGSFA